MKEDEAETLVQLLFRRGYLGNNDNKSNFKDDRVMFPVKGTNGTGYASLEYLVKTFQNQLEKHGRLSSREPILSVDPSAMQCISATVLQQDSSLRQAGEDLVTTAWVEQHLQEVLDSLTNSQQSHPLLVSDIAQTTLRLPFDMTLSLLKEKTSKSDCKGQVRSLDSGSQVLVSSQLLSKIQDDVVDTIWTCVEPVNILALCKERNWQVSWVTKILNDVATSVGELTGDQFVPRVFFERQKQLTLDKYSSDGYVLLDNASGLRRPQVLDAVQSEHPTAQVLPNIIVHPGIITAPLEASLQEACLTGGWVDVSLHLPLELLQQEADAKTLFYDLILSKLEYSSPVGAAVLFSIGGVFLSKLLIDEVNRDVLPALVERFSRQEAEKRRDQTNSFVPLAHLADALVRFRSDFGEVQRDILIAACDKAFVTEENVKRFQNAIEAERKMAQSASKSTTMTSSLRRDPACRVQSIKESFEATSCFATACYMIQKKWRFVQHATDAGCSDNDVQTLRKELLDGCCADLLCRLTQYCCFKNGVDMEQFSFGLPPTPDFHAPVDTAVLRYRQVYFECSGGGPPLPVLRELLPSTAGKPLSTLWQLCGDSNFCSVHISGTESESVEKFLDVLEESCLPICGLPFKQLDKKMEKKLLLARKERLHRALEQAIELSDVLDLTVMSLFQSVKGFVVSGTLLSSSILKLLSDERKVSAETAESLQALAQAIEEKRTETDLVERVRKQGLYACGKKGK